MHLHARKTAPRVRGGTVQWKNRRSPTASYWNAPQALPVIDRQRPGEGYRHVLLVRHVQRFIELLPDWRELSRGLNAIVLAPGESYTMGWHSRGVVAVCAWERRLWQEWNSDFVEWHREPLNRLGVPIDRPDACGLTRCHFTEHTARGFQLLHILLHELGHHHDRMTTRSRLRPGRGEMYAEEYSMEYASRIYERYFEEFGW